MHFIERYFDISPDLEALIMVVLFMLTATVGLWLGKTAEHKRANRN